MTRLSRRSLLALAALLTIAATMARICWGEDASPPSRAVLPQTAEGQFLIAQHDLARRLPQSQLARASIAIQPDRVVFLDPTTGAPLVTLIQSDRPPWFAPLDRQIPESDLQLLLDCLGRPPRPSPWRTSSATAEQHRRGDWLGQPMRQPWQVWLVAAAAWLGMAWMARAAVEAKRGK